MIAERLRWVGARLGRVGISATLICLALGVLAAPSASASVPTITTPSANPFTISLDASGNALPFDVVTQGYPQNELVFIEMCDGLSSSDPSWNITTDCDIATSPAGVPANASGQVSFPAGNRNTAIHDFNGQGPSDIFNCLSDSEINAFGDATPGAFPGEFMLGPNDTTTATGQTVDPNVPAWDNCQLMSTSNKSSFTSDEAFITLTIPGGPAQADMVSLQASPSSPQNVGTAITLTSTVIPSGSAAPLTGTLSFKATVGGSTSTICPSVAPSSGTCVWTPAAAGTYSLVATYGGDAVYPTESSSSVSYVINGTAPADTVFLQASPSSPQNVGAAITLTSTVTPSDSAAALTGTLSFTATTGGSTITICPSVAPRPGTCTWTPSAAGTYTLVATYSGDAVYPTGSSAGVSYTVVPSGPTITTPGAKPFTISLDASGNALPFDVVAQGYPQGGLVFIEICDGLSSSDSSWSITTDCDIATSPAGVPANASGQVSFPAGNRNTAIHDFNGQSRSDIFNCLSDSEINAFGDATAGAFPGEFMLGPNDTTTATGQTVDPNVPAWDNCQLMSTSNKSAFTPDEAFDTLTIPSIGTHGVTISLQADHSSPQPALTPIELTAAAEPSSAGGPVLTGTLTFFDGAAAISPACTNVPIGTSTCTWVPSGAGTRSLTVEYNGDPVYQATTSPPLAFTISKLASRVNLSYSPQSGISQGDVLTITATLTGAGSVPTGFVQFTSNGAAVVGCEAQPINQGMAFCETTLLDPGTDVLAAPYGGDSTYSGSVSNQTLVTVTLQPPPVRAIPTLFLNADPLNPSPGESFDLFLSVYGPGQTTPTGSVAFYANGQSIGACRTVRLANGLAVCRMSIAASGTYHMTAAYSGDKSYLPAISAPEVIRVSEGGYWMAASDGGVLTFGAATFYGSLGAVHLAASIVAMAGTPDDHGYWLAASDGGVFTFGDATFVGSLGAVHLAAPIVAIVPTSDGQGYWLVASDGGVFAFGDARFEGSLGHRHLNAPIIGMAATPSGRGYWLAASDGGIFAFGDAPFLGSLGDRRLAKPVVAIASPDVRGYWLAASDGGVFSFGDVRFLGSAAASHLVRPVTAMASVGGAYRLFTSDGGVFDFGGLPFLGSATRFALTRPVVAAATAA